jgi:hypothetical protein
MRGFGLAEYLDNNPLEPTGDLEGGNTNPASDGTGPAGGFAAMGFHDAVYKAILNNVLTGWVDATDAACTAGTTPCSTITLLDWRNSASPMSCIYAWDSEEIARPFSADASLVAPDFALATIEYQSTDPLPHGAGNPLLTSPGCVALGVAGP